MRDVVTYHGEDRQLRHASLFSLDDASALIKHRKIGVHVAGIPPSSGNLLPRSTYLPKRFAVVCHVCEDHKDMRVMLIGEIFRGGESHARSHEALNRRIVRKIEKDHAPLQSAGLLEILDEVLGFLVGYSHRCENHHEILLFPDDFRLARYLKRDLIVGKA